MENIQFLGKWAYVVAFPIFIAFILLELYIGWKEGNNTYKKDDTKNNFISGIVFVIVGIAIKSAKLFVFYVIYDHFRLYTLPVNEIWVWVTLFFLEDLTNYWGHRIGHKVSFYWASHVVHHNSEIFNLSTAFRKTWTYDITGHFLIWAWLVIIGFDPLMVFLVKTFNFLYQFFVHTEKVGKLHPIIEFIFNTPSHHRVHHGSDLKYMDRNLGGILIIWDRLFGTFQEEEEKPNYGITNNIKSENIFVIEFHEWKSLWKRVLADKSWKNRLKYIFGHPGWSPDKSTLTVNELRSLESKN